MITLESIQRAKTSKKALALFVKENEGIIWTQVFAVMGFNTKEEQADGFQEGVLGLLEAMESFDPAKATFSPRAFLIESAKNKIKHHLLNLCKAGFIIHDAYVLFKNRIDSNGGTEFLTKDDKWVTFRKVETWTNVVKNENGYPVVFVGSLSKKNRRASGDGFSLEETISANVEFTEEAVVRHLTSDRIIDKFINRLEKLSKRDAYIVRSYFGLGRGLKPSTFRDIAKHVDISFQAVAKIVTKEINAFHASLTVEEKQSI